MGKFIVDSAAEGLVTLRVPNTNYRNTFKLAGGAAAPAVGQRVSGTIHAPAWKADVVEQGGNYVEPLVGRPRRMQGNVLAVDAARNELTVHVGYDVTVKLPDKDKATAFPVGARIAWDNVDLPTFTMGS